MTLRPEYSLGHSEFNDFLFAFVGKEKSGLQLTVLSALARIGVDPWREAARLSELPKEAATCALAATIGALPEGDWKTSDSRSIAVRLVDCLPKHSSSKTGSVQDAGQEDQSPKAKAPQWLVWIALGAAVLFAILRLYADKVSQPDLSDVWSQKPHLVSVAVIDIAQLASTGGASLSSVWFPRRSSDGDSV
jgi:hypothetical protein